MQLKPQLPSPQSRWCRRTVCCKACGWQEWEGKFESCSCFLITLDLIYGLVSTVTMLHFYVNVLSTHLTVSVAENGTCICICSMLSKLMKFNGMFNRHNFDRKEWNQHWLSVLLTHMNDVTYITFQYIYIWMVITMFSPEYYCYTVLYYTILKLHTNLWFVVWFASTFTLMFSSFHRS